jgi:integral membrane protein
MDLNETKAKATLPVYLRLFCIIARWEGVSLLVLLLVAMPLKYIWNIPEWVTYVGWVHGLLFVAYAISLVYVQFREWWGLEVFFISGLSAFLPLATFYVEREVKRGRYRGRKQQG